MKIHIPRRARRAAFGGTAALALLGLAACDFGPDGDPDVIAFAGSDTTQDVVGALVNDYNADPNYNEDPDIPGVDKDSLDNILSVEANPNLVAGDEHCGNLTYHTPPTPPEVVAPNGSSAGRDALKASVQANNGCIDVARSSAGPRPAGTGAGQDLPTFQYYAFALDAVGYSTASTAAPANLTLAQLQGIYNCTFTNWNQVGGANQAIERYWPQAGSGTRAFFQSDVLGFDPTLFSGGSCPAVQLTQENTGQVIAANGDQQSGIVPFSGANWVAMARGTIIPDQRAGQVIRNLNGQNIITGSGAGSQLATPAATGDPNAPVQEANVRLVDPTPAYPGIRFVFNVVDSSSASYTSAIRYVGFENVTDGATAPLCSGGKSAILVNFGFGPLDNTAGPRNVPGSTCRFYAPV
jgi:phosphate transport system substrate-binding protein